MRRTIAIPGRTEKVLRRHLFQNDLEQGAFLFAQTDANAANVVMTVMDYYLVPPNGWEVQMGVYLQMRDSERAKIMKIAREKNLAAIDCHSHPHANDDVWFSPSDIAGITEFSQYARWKLDGKPFAAMVWGENSIDAVIWHDDFSEAHWVNEVQIAGRPGSRAIPNGSWFRPSRGFHRFKTYE